MRIYRYFLPLIILGLISSPVWAADEAVIQDLQSDVTVTKGKADKNSQEIESLKGGLPALEARVAALEGALNDANGKIGQLKAQVDALAAAFSDVATTADRAAADASAAATAAEAARFAADRAGQAAGAAQSTADQALSAAAEANVRIDELSAVDVTELENRVSDVEETLTCVSFDSITMDFILVGCNVHVRNGVGTTDSLNGFGNLVIGYDTDIMQTLDRSGSHNLILGDEQTYPNSGQLLAQFVGSNQDLQIQSGNNLDMASGSDMQILAGNDLNESISNDRSTTVGRDSSLLIGRNLTEAVTQDLSMQAGHNMSVRADDQISLTTGSAMMLMKKDGTIGIDGKDVSVTASGDINIKAAANVIVRGSAITHN